MRHCENYRVTARKPLCCTPQTFNALMRVTKSGRFHVLQNAGLAWFWFGGTHRLTERICTQWKPFSRLKQSWMGISKPCHWTCWSLVDADWLWTMENIIIPCKNVCFMLPTTGNDILMQTVSFVSANTKTEKDRAISKLIKVAHFVQTYGLSLWSLKNVSFCASIWKRFEQRTNARLLIHLALLLSDCFLL